MKKTLVILIITAMLTSLCIPALAANITINGGEGRDYEAYKLLDASVSGENYAYQINPIYKDILIASLSLGTPTDEEIITAISAITTAEAMRHFSDAVYHGIKDASPAISPDKTWSGETTALDQGYWLVADITDLEGQNKTNSLVMVDTVGDKDVTVNLKPSTIVTDKKVDDENDSIINPSLSNEDEISLRDSADYDIGDHVPFAIKITMPNNIAEYKYYSFIINDSVSEGLTYDNASFKIYIGNTEKVVAAPGTPGADFYIEFETVEVGGVQESQSFKLYPAHNYTKNDGTSVTANKTDGGDYLKVFAAGTPHDQINNTVITLQYTCTLNENAKVGAEGNPNEYILKYSNNPYSDTFGETPKDTVIVLTYRTVFTKVDHNGTELTGADFTLYKFVARLAYLPENEAAALANGYIHHAGANAYGEFVEVTRKTVNAEGTEFTFNGLDDGFYKIEETVVPTGYNGIEPIEFKIEATHVMTYTGSEVALTTLSGKTQFDQIAFATDSGTGSLSASIENRSGTELPTTGGTGTTLMYIGGISLIVVAGVVLVTRKRMALES